MKQLSTNEIRQIWLDFFKEHGHAVEESASLIPNNDPTLLWINAGVAPLKKYFDGSIIPSNPRIVNAQKCIRTNDINNVGKTARHHTFFEMLGNFSIGDYFRDEIIPWAYTLLTDDRYYGMDPNKLYFTVYPDDEETIQAWLNVGVKRGHIIKCEHNFWEIGEGPCGPDTEIFYDRGEAFGDIGLDVIEHDIENDRYIEIWNIVFSQFNAKKELERDAYPELPSKNIDTGMGLERMACVMQGAETNYETDIFMALNKKISEISHIEYTGQMSFKVIADHIRTVTFAVADGAILSNEGRGYVLRRLLRRAVKHGKQLGISKAFLYKLVDTVIEQMGTYYTYLSDNSDIIKKVVRKEEEKFLETLTQGEKLLENLIEDSDNQTITGDNAFKLYDTYGFPIELTIELAEEHGYIVDETGFKEEMDKQKERARNARKDTLSMKEQNEAYLNFRAQDTFTGYDSLVEETRILKAFDEGVVLECTPFYAESGGQVADTGVIQTKDETYYVKDVQKMPNGQFLHYIDDHNLTDGDSVKAEVDEMKRLLTMYHHSATHLLFGALREIVGEHVSQQGSNVSSDALRFDFNNYDPLDDEILLKVEERVNDKIRASIPVVKEEVPLEKAKAMGAIAEFGEKYTDKVRVINMDYTIDLCGGTHVDNTGDIGHFAIANIENKGSGIYRITAHVNEATDNIRKQFTGFHKEMKKLINKANNIVKDAKAHGIDVSFDYQINHSIKASYQAVIDKRLEFEHLQELVRDLEKNVKEALKEQTFNQLDDYLDHVKNNTLVLKLDAIDKDALKPLADRLLEHLPNGFVFLANVLDNKVTFIAKSDNDDYHSGKIAKAAAMICGGNGGGRPQMAQAGGKDVSKVDTALAHVKELVQ
ncbi:MAG: alanine--tRNA ligase [Candidatus Izemoplasma sp.]|nr:alanine--tRNA ligase [Candidatus Izemoplasma sp.]